MKVAKSWLNEFVDISDITPKQYADAVTMSGTMVEGFEELGAELQNVVTGKILEIEKHEHADSLVVCQLDVGTEKLQIVTGAKNVKVGQIVPVALHGSKLAGGVSIKHAFVVGLARCFEHVERVLAHLVAVALQGLLGHTQTAEGHEGALQRSICLQTYDGFKVFVDIACGMRYDGGYYLFIGVEHATGVNFLLHEQLHLVPQGVCALCSTGEETLVTLIGRVVLLDEIAYVDGLGPHAALKSLPLCVLAGCLTCSIAHINYRVTGF